MASLHATVGRAWSLRDRLHALVSGAVFVACVAGALATVWATEREGDRLCREYLASLAQTVLGFSQHEINEIRSDNAELDVVNNVHQETVATLPRRYAYQIWSDKGELLLRSVNAPGDRPLGTHGRDGYSEGQLGGEPYEAFVLRNPSWNMEVHVADLEDGQSHFQIDLGMFFGLMVLLAVIPILIATSVLLRRSLASFAAVSSQLRHRGVTDLTPLSIDQPPQELEPLVEATNRLMSQVDHALSQERGFTSMAAHELRTPLAALRMQAQVVQRAATDDERHEGLGRLLRGVDRCTRMVNQLLELARVDQLQLANDMQRWFDIHDAVAEVLSDYEGESRQRGIDISSIVMAGRLRGDRVAFQTLLRNLVSNAMRHVPDGGVVSVFIDETRERIGLRVDDSGPGIPEAERDHVFERFYRPQGARGQGVGLGLAIVAAVAKAHRAAIRLGESTLGGLRVEVSFPSVCAPTEL